MPDALSRVPRPRLATLLPDGGRVSAAQRVTALVRPWPPLLLFLMAAVRGWWPLATVAMAFVFAADVVVLHDLFHRNLGLSPRVNDRLTTLYACLVLNSGHALAVSHRHHHRVYPAAGDPEAYVDGWPVWRVVLEGPRYRFRVWRWALLHHRRARRVLGAEMAVWVMAWIMAIAWGAHVPALRAYVVLAELGSWTFPLVSVTGVHDRHAAGPLRQTRTLRAPLLGRLMLGMQYHLEHHLYPRVPACRLPELAEALDPWLSANDAAVWGRDVGRARAGLPSGAPTIRA